MSPAKFDLIIFDCDGVLIDSEMLSCTCLSAFLCEQGFQVSLNEVFDRFLGRSFAVVEDYCASASGRPPDAGFAIAFRSRLRDRFTRDLRPMAGVEAVLASLETPFCVASSSDRDRLAFSLGLTGLASYMGDRVYSSDHVKTGKPAPDLFLFAADRMRTPPARTLVIEDSINGVRAGKAAGMTVWGFVGGSHHGEGDGAGSLSAAGADTILGSMADFPAL